MSTDKPQMHGKTTHAMTIMWGIEEIISGMHLNGPSSPMMEIERAYARKAVATAKTVAGT
jgi:hypothetical protein